MNSSVIARSLPLAVESFLSHLLILFSGFHVTVTVFVQPTENPAFGACQAGSSQRSMPIQPALRHAKTKPACDGEEQALVGANPAMTKSSLSVHRERRLGLQRPRELTKIMISRTRYASRSHQKFNEEASSFVFIVRYRFPPWVHAIGACSVVAQAICHRGLSQFRRLSSFKC